MTSKLKTNLQEKLIFAHLPDTVSYCFLLKSEWQSVFLNCGIFHKMQNWC